VRLPLSLRFLVSEFFFEEVLDEYLATLNVRWSNDTGLALDV
jgi:hypothetical protein